MTGDSRLALKTRTQDSHQAPRHRRSISSQDDNGLRHIKVCFPEIVTEIGGARAAAAAPAREQDAQHPASFDLAALAARQHAWCQACARKTAPTCWKTAPTCSTCLAPTAQACPRAAARDAVAAWVVDARCRAQEHALGPGVACARLPAWDARPRWPHAAEPVAGAGRRGARAKAIRLVAPSLCARTPLNQARLGLSTCLQPREHTTSIAVT
jgi:hypothetical protein